MNVVFKYNTKRLTWDSIVLAIVMTSMFARHCADGNKNPDYILAIFNGLYLAMDYLKCLAERLGGWVSDPNYNQSVEFDQFIFFHF